MEFLTSNWLYIVIWGAMAYMMFKSGGCCGGHSQGTHSYGENSHGGGCCGGHQHGNHNSENYRYMEQEKYNNRLDAVKDPICGMSVKPDTAIREKIGDKTYYFCSEQCRVKFISQQNY